MPDKKQIIEVKGTPITIIQVNQADYISLTDMVKKFEDGLALIEKWLRNKAEHTLIKISLSNSDHGSAPSLSFILQLAARRRT